MTIFEAITIIKAYNKWRRADEDMEMPDPKQLGIAIDLAIKCMEGLSGKINIPDLRKSVLHNSSKNMS